MTILGKLTLALVAAGTIAAAVPAQAAVPFAPQQHPAAVAYGEGWQRDGQPSWYGRGQDRRYDDDGDRGYERSYERSYERTEWRGDRRDGWQNDRGDWRRDDRRDWRNDRDREVSYQSAAWRGRDGRYYCRKPDGTTGLLVGGAAGALIGRGIAGPYGDRTLGAILGAAGGALLGRAIDRDSARCR